MTASSTSASPSSRGAVEELGDQQVLPLRGELDEAVAGAGPGSPASPHHAQRVVLLLHQPPHGVERLLVLQPAVQQLPAELVPAVGAQMAAARRACRTGSLAGASLTVIRSGVEPAELGQPERLDLAGGQAQLVLQRPADRLAACPADVQMGACGPAGR